VAETSTSRPQRGAELVLSIDSLAFGGAGVARHDGYVVFVEDAVPGDRVRATVHKSKRAYAQARASEILEPSPDRVPARAAHPGVPWQVLPYERQLQIKQDQLEDALRRLGHLDGFSREPIVPAAQTWRYRNKLEYSFGAGSDGRLICGFHAPGRWDEIVEVNDCLLSSERGNAMREAIVDWCRRQGLRSLDRRSGEGFLRNLVIRESHRTGELLVRLLTTRGELEREGLSRAASDASALLWTQTNNPAESTQGGLTEVLAGVEHLEEQLFGMRIRVSPEAFFQTNTEMAEQLYRLAIEFAEPHGAERAYDLFCGIGTIALILAPRLAEVWGVELHEDAVRDAIENARLNEVANARFYAGDVRLAMPELRHRAGPPDLLIVDPPRAGLSRKVVRRLIEAAPRRIVYVSCNPTTLTPNAAQLEQAGYRLRRVRSVDMFPQTPHIECVALLERL
jgi:23S rRNA (uracil1939-C5)-methyltransferase